LHAVFVNQAVFTVNKGHNAAKTDGQRPRLFVEHLLLMSAFVYRWTR